MENQNQNPQNNVQATENLKFCKHCGQKIPEAAVVCPMCGCQVEELKSQANNQAPIVINNTNTNANTNVNTNVAAGMTGKPKNKMVALLLCIFLGYLGAHKFYEGKTGMGIVYIFTVGLFGIGWIIDIIALIAKPSTYYV